MCVVLSIGGSRDRWLRNRVFHLAHCHHGWKTRRFEARSWELHISTQMHHVTKHWYWCGHCLCCSRMPEWNNSYFWFSTPSKSKVTCHRIRIDDLVVGDFMAINIFTPIRTALKVMMNKIVHHKQTFIPWLRSRYVCNGPPVEWINVWGNYC